jgi:hypothetical protein
MTTEQARQVLRDNGYFVDNLWHVDDVPMGTDEERMEVLEKALTNPWVFEQIHYGIGEAMRDIGLELNEINETK